MRKTLNKEKLCGRVYEHNLTLRTVQKAGDNFGKEFINGTLDIAVDDDCLNIVQIHYSYVTETTKKGTKNNTFTTLKKIIDEPRTVLVDGKDNAMMVTVDTSLDLNDFYTDRNGETTLVAAKRNEGGFITIVNTLPPESDRNRFDFDMLINGTQYVEADPERNIDKDYLIVKGAIFNFRNDIKPVELIVKNEGGIKFFESLDASPKNLIFTRVWGYINSETVVREVTEESAFGEPSVRKYTRNVREWIITGTYTQDKFYEIGDAENGITEEDIKKAMADREVHLAEVKKNQEEYQASKNGGGAGTANQAVAPAAAGGFNF